MKLSFLFVLGFAALCSTSYADVTQIITVEKEAGLEADHETMQIKDLEAERKMAKEQAMVQGQIAKEAKDRLDKVETQKSISLDKAKSEIANYEYLRKDAEKNNKKYKEETERLTSDIKKVEDNTDKARRATKDAQDIANAGREELRITKDRKAKAEQDNKQALYAQARAEADMERLRQEYARVVQSLKDLEQKVALNQEEAKKKQAMVAIGAHKVADLQSKENQYKTALGMRPSVLPVANIVPKTAAPRPVAKAASQDDRQPNSDAAAPAAAPAPEKQSVDPVVDAPKTAEASKTSDATKQ